MTDSQIVSDFIYTMYPGVSVGTSVADVICSIGVGCLILGIIAEFVRRTWFKDKRLPSGMGNNLAGLGAVLLIILCLLSSTIREASRANARRREFKNDMTGEKLKEYHMRIDAAILEEKPEWRK